MQEIWGFFKLFELVLGTFCIYFHVAGFLDPEPLPHNLFFCGTFFGFALFSLFGVMAIYINSGPTPLMEAISSSCGAILHIIASILTMNLAENDFHLMYLSDFEEPLHPFFHYCKAQSVSALACGCFYLMHTIFAVDALVIHQDPENSFSGSQNEIEDQEDGVITELAARPIEMYVFGKAIHTKLLKYKWFRRIAEQ